MQTIENDLKEIGLKENEIRVYMAVLELGEANIAQITQRSEINRSTVYLVLERLKERGLVLRVKKNKTLFYVEDPREMLRDLEKRKEVLEKVMPSLLASFAFIDKKPEVQYFEGIEGIKEIYKDVLRNPNLEMLAWYSNDYREFFDKKFFFEFFIPERKKKRIWLRAIYPENESMRKLASNNVEHLRKTKFIDNEKFLLESEICLYGKNKIGIIAYQDKLGIIISSQNIFNTLKAFFEVMWDGASE